MVAFSFRLVPIVLGAAFFSVNSCHWIGWDRFGCGGMSVPVIGWGESFLGVMVDFRSSGFVG